jgi:hypothetical protein
MKYFNTVVFAGLILSGFAMLAGFFIGNGGLEGLGAYFGWFSFVCSVMAYLLKSLGILFRGVTVFWGTLYPANFGLGLLGLSVFGIHEQRTMIVMGVVLLFGSAASLVMRRTQALRKRYVPIAVPLLLGIAAMVQPVFEIWMYLCVFVGILLLAIAAGESKLVEHKSHVS